VLLTDREAEHIPGCNMAYRKSALLEIGGFDERFRIAGDDVDACWSLQKLNWKLGFSPAAVVWHHRRNSVRTYLKQQRATAEPKLYSRKSGRENTTRLVMFLGRQSIWQRFFSRFFRGPAEYTKEFGEPPHSSGSMGRTGMGLVSGLDARMVSHCGAFSPC